MKNYFILFITILFFGCNLQELPLEETFEIDHQEIKEHAEARKLEIEKLKNEIDSYTNTESLTQRKSTNLGFHNFLLEKEKYYFLKIIENHNIYFKDVENYINKYSSFALKDPENLRIFKINLSYNFDILSHDMAAEIEMIEIDSKIHRIIVNTYFVGSNNSKDEILNKIDSLYDSIDGEINKIYFKLKDIKNKLISQGLFDK